MKKLTDRELAIIAKKHLADCSEFTLDKFGQNARVIAVSSAVKRISGKPSLDEIVAYLHWHPLDAAFFIGWYDPTANITYLGHLK